MRPKLLVSGALLVLAVVCLHPQSHSQAAPQDHAQTSQRPVPPTNRKTAATHNSEPQDEGDRIFQQNCSRCHWAPDGFSSRISGTIVRHMRVRASLSEHDEQELLRFLNP